MRQARAVAIVALAMAVVGVACDGDEEPQAAPSPSAVVTPPAVASAPPTATVTPATACAGQEVALERGLRAGGIVRGDVDGDGVLDGVSIVLDPSAEPGCVAFVAVETTERTFAAPVWQVGREGGLSEPRLNSLADIDGRPGQEVVVDEAAGASTQFVGAFTIFEGELVRMENEGAPAATPPAFAGLFPFGGSVGHLEAVDCAGDGRVVVSVATPSGGGGDVYNLERRFFTIDGATLEEARVQEQRVPISQLEAFPEFQAGPFGSC